MAEAAPSIQEVSGLGSLEERFAADPFLHSTVLIVPCQAMGFVIMMSI